MNKKWIAICLSLVLVVSLTSCKQKEELEYAAGDSYISLTDDSYIFMRMNNGQTTYYRQYLDTGLVKDIGTIENFVLSAKGAAKVGERIYFTALINDNGLEYVGLFEIDLETNTLSEVSKDAECSYDAYTFQCGKYVAVAKNVYNEATILSYIELYDPESKTALTILEKEIDTAATTGEIILRACSSDNELFILNDIGQGENFRPETTITKYIVDGEEGSAVKKDSVSLESVQEYIMAARVYQFLVMNSYVYMSNFSNDSVFGKIDGEIITPIIQGRNVEFAGVTDNHILLYERGSDKIIIVNIESGEYVYKNVETKYGYSIKCILLMGDNVVTVTKSPGKEDFIYVRQTDDVIG